MIKMNSSMKIIRSLNYLNRGLKSQYIQLKKCIPLINMTQYNFCSKPEIENKLSTVKPEFSQFQCKQLLSQPNHLRQVILDHINRFGQMKLDKYWKIALTDSEHGYYSQKNVFSKEGDFTTSPQISPLFGQLIAVWIVYFLTKAGIIDQNTQTVTKKFRLVEFGPGRGLLMRDIVKSLHDMKVENYFDISFVQVSQYNRKCQQDNVFQQFKKYDKFFRFEFQNQNKEVEVFKAQNQFHDINLKWYPNFEFLVKEDYDNLQNGKQAPLTVFLMNQFFDALSTSIFQYTQKGWRQKVIVKSNNKEFPFELKNSSKEIPEKLRPTIKNLKVGQRIEISHESLITMDTMAKLLLRTKGAVLNVDYGGSGSYSNSIRGIKQHKFIPQPYLWQIPGKCDLSAYVNFSALGDFAQNNYGIKAFEPIPQGYFLQAMGINPRIDILQKTMNKQQKQKLQSQYNRLVHPQQMGENFKVQCITLKQYGELYPWIIQKQGVY